MLLISSAGCEVFISGKKELLEELAASDFTSKYIPDVIIDEVEAKHQEGFQLHLVPGDEMCFEFRNTSAELKYISGGNVSTRDFISVIDYCLEYVRQKNGIYNIHGSACSKDGKAVLFIGPISGLGKTSSVLTLCQKYGFSFIGDEKVLVGKDLRLYGGVTTLEFNKPVLHEIVGSSLNNHDAREETQISLEKQAVSPRLIVLPMIAPGTEFKIEKWETDKTDWHIYEELTRKIRGVSRRINGFNYALPSIDDSSLAASRVALAKNIADNIEVITLRGTHEDVWQHVPDILA